uniref:ATP synthase F0 subunit 8 n=1 Tax=Odontoscelis fuliginosa TaxID=1191092 RepID=A0A2P1CLT2_9HEMI|nr:ATP synthase F0 subunit 8 [Odontoscelis fuliginosa]
MPQMAPLYWEVLYFIFIMSMMAMAVIIYHQPKITNITKMTDLKDTNQMNWKW